MAAAEALLAGAALAGAAVDPTGVKFLLTTGAGLSDTVEQAAKKVARSEVSKSGRTSRMEEPERQRTPDFRGTKCASSTHHESTLPVAVLR
ncbi:hypothetical protein THIX_30242 [Thiomonas sp. X19]|nr:hypothetical protein THIX_30242 [Thiomonas sp. X19]